MMETRVPHRAGCPYCGLDGHVSHCPQCGRPAPCKCIDWLREEPAEAYEVPSQRIGSCAEDCDD